MPAIARVNQDSAGGLINQALVPNVVVNGKSIAVIGETVAPHGPEPHADATLAEGSSTVFAGGISVSRKGDLATCGDAISSGSSNVFAG